MSEQDSPALPLVPLTLAPGLRTRVDAAGHVLVDTPLGGIVDAGPDGLAILALFARPRTVAAAMLALAQAPSPTPELMPAKATIVQLVTSGAVVEPQSTGTQFGWTDPAEHARMLGDRRRTDTYLAAIRSAVRPDDVVLDIGTGSGVLAVAAAQAGARRVFAIEASDIASVARQVFEANGVTDQVTLIEGWSSEVELPERATLLVTETLGVEPFEEDILGTVLDARQRLLTPTARLIPRALRLDVRPLSVPDVRRWSSRVDEADIAAWREHYGIELGPLRDARRRAPLHWSVDSRIVAEWMPLARPTELVHVDLRSHDSSALEARTSLAVERAGVIDAFLMTFSAELGPGIRLDHAPRPDETSNWDASLWFLSDGLEVEPGERLELGYHFGMAGHADGLTCRRDTE